MKKLTAMLLVGAMTFGMTVNAAATETIVIENNVTKESEKLEEATPTPTATATPTPAPTAGATADTAVQSNTTISVTSNKTYLALGSDLSADQRSTVLALMGIAEADLPNYDVVYVTNAEEHQRLDTYIASSVIGTRSLSSVVVRPAEKGHGVTVTTKNINYCTENMYRNALITAGVESCIEATKNRRVGIIGTQATIRSGAYERGIIQRVPDMQVFGKACPLFVNLAEEGWTDNEIAHLTASAYLDELLQNEVDTIVLGCTHYPLLKRCISKVVGENVTLVDPAKATAMKMKRFLEENDMLGAQTQGKRTFYVSDHTQSFDTLCERLLKQHYTAEKTDIEKY